MKFSVLMSVYYKENPEWLEIALESVFNQTVIPNEVVLIQDGLLTVELNRVIDNFCRKYPTVFKTYRIDNNVGLGKALNYGLSKCSNDLVARMDTDDIAKNNRFELQLKEFEQNSKLAICGGQIEEFDGNRESNLDYRIVPEKFEDILKLCAKRNPLNHVTVMFKKSVILSVGGYQDMPYFEDYWLWARVLNKGYKVKNIPMVLVRVRAGIDMISRRGGIKYIINTISFEFSMYRIGMISFATFIYITVIRVLISILPVTLRNIFYINFLRKSKYIIR